MGSWRARRASATIAVAVAALAAGCTAENADPAAPAPTTGSASVTTQATPTEKTEQTGRTPSASSPPEGEGRPPRRLRVADLDPRIAMRAVRRLAGRIGPRHATSAAYDEAARWAADELRALGYRVRNQSVRVPGGNSWGAPVEAGTSVNVVAAPPGMGLSRPHVVIGAHLDTVPQAPGAEDNASGVGVLLAVAAAVAEARTRLPVVFVAFGAEEPRGPSDDDHHYGSRAYVAGLTGAERRAVRAMVSLDRVGVGSTVPVGSAVAGDPLQRALLSAAWRAGVPAFADAFSRSSDHWSFVRGGLPGARLGGTPYAGYHSAGDTVDVVDPAQLARTGRLLLSWLR